MQTQTEPVADRDMKRAEARLPKWMTALAALATLAVLGAGHARAAAGFALGATLAIVNYYWLHQAVETLFRVNSARVPRKVLVKFLLRYPLAVLAIYLVYRRDWLPLGAILAGLFVPVGGVLIEAMVQLKEGFRIRET